MILLTNLFLFNVMLSDEPEIPAVSRSGRVIKKSTKLLDFEFSDSRM